MAEPEGISVVLTPVQLFAMLNDKSIGESELAGNFWHELPVPPEIQTAFPRPSGPNFDAIQRFVHEPYIAPPRPNARAQPCPSCHDDWAPQRPASSTFIYRFFAGIQIIGGALETVGGALLVLAPDPTLLSKPAGGILAVHGADVTQAAVRQLFSGKPVDDFTVQGSAWAARKAGASPQTAHRIGVILDVAVPIGTGGALVAERVVAGRAAAARLAQIRAARAIRDGRLLLSEQVVAGKAGKISLALEEEVKDASGAVAKRGGHTLERHVNVTDADITARAQSAANINKPNFIASRFFTPQIAEDAVNAAVKANRAAIRAWAADLTRTAPQEFELTVDQVVGRGFMNATGQIHPFSAVRVVFARGTQFGKPIYILTAYPIP